MLIGSHLLNEENWEFFKRNSYHTPLGLLDTKCVFKITHLFLEMYFQTHFFT